MPMPKITPDNSMAKKWTNLQFALTFQNELFGWLNFANFQAKRQKWQKLSLVIEHWQCQIKFRLYPVNFCILKIHFRTRNSSKSTNFIAIKTMLIAYLKRQVLLAKIMTKYQSKLFLLFERPNTNIIRIYKFS